MLPMLPAFWLGGMVMALEVLSVGATLVYPGSPEIGVVLAAIERFQVNRINGWGDMLPKLRHAAIARGIDVDAMVGLGLFRYQSGELIPPHLPGTQHETRTCEASSGQSWCVSVIAVSLKEQIKREKYA